ncbi:tetratricopeptide repeat domain protein [Rhypophila decipiens]|uniref:Tetratricopeptide repeat domain protein n=1 Tax=Rhypophila decipiens TaxID=261697 RepID=A0AAN7BAB0_9PEZI|nr:tetratricopeptide repeat domain protein [Rhypophila decipiens]
MTIHPGSEFGSGEYFNLGTFHKPITTSSPEAQKWFDRGLVWCFGFNHHEAIRCFERAVAVDPECAMAYWGTAYALGPNYNKPWSMFDKEEKDNIIKKAVDSLTQAQKKSSLATPVEQALINALQSRFPQPQETDSRSKPLPLNQRYAHAMESVYQKHAEDLDVAALYVDALMNVTPWKLWDLKTGAPVPGARTLEAQSILEKALAKDQYHPGLIHLYIHLMEMSSHPEVALRVADNLRGLVPDAGHLNHMPSHIDILCGDYRRAVAANSQAVVADEKFVQYAGPMNFYSLYRCHDYHFRIYAAMFAGQSAVALDTVVRLEQSLPESLLRVESPPMADWLEGFLAMRVHVLIRFGRWQDIIDLEIPKDTGLYCTTTAMIHYAKGVALAATGHVPAAEEQRGLFQQAVKAVPESRTLFNNSCRDLLAIAASMLDGELEYRRGNWDTAFAMLRESIERDDALPYDEPWGWMQPTRHAYGALLLEQGRVDEAAAVYAADLGFDDTLPRALQHRNNVWSLHGFYECLNKLGRVKEARIIKPQLELAMAVADVPIRSSCFCRTRTAISNSKL